jgi:hypothetical protein
MSNKSGRKIKEIIIHCSASTFGNAVLIDSWHRKNGWDKIGYHFVILNGWLSKDLFDESLDGLLETGRHFLEQGAHTKGHNKDSLGVCLIGEEGKFSRSQLLALSKLIGGLKGKFPEAEVKFHSDYNKDKPWCPGFDVKTLFSLCVDS